MTHKDLSQSSNYVFLPIAALESEAGYFNVSPKDMSYREELVQHLRKLPKDALQSMRHFQTQIGCLNRCSFCSQSAGTTLWNMHKEDLANLIAALKTVGLELAYNENQACAYPLKSTGIFSDEFVMPPNGLIGNKRSDRPGVIYCYLDNDPASYPHLDDLIQWFYEDLGVKVRIATVGYSRLNFKIQSMHSKISNKLMAGVAGIRLSFSPYTYGWTKSAEKFGVTTRTDFEHDVATMLDTYRTTFLSDLKGRKGACVELRFSPLIVSSSVEIFKFNNHLIIKSGPYLIIKKEQGENDLKDANIISPTDHNTQLSFPGTPCWLVYGAPDAIREHYPEIIKELLETKQLRMQCFSYRDTLLNRLRNEDGEYFAIDANRTSDGWYSKYFYPKVGNRPGDGYIDGERYLLNQLIKLSKDSRNNKKWSDVTRLIDNLYGVAKELIHDIYASKYIYDHLIPLVESYVRVLRLAKYPPSAFFDKEITVDTGHICNLGRAYSEYRHIASRPDLPLTPQHERAFGLNGELAKEGLAWRLAVAPMRSEATMANARGKRNAYSDTPSILVECLDLSMTATPEGQSKARFFLPLRNIARISIQESKFFPVIPGHVVKKEILE